MSTLTEIQSSLRSKLRQYPDFPSKGVLFEDIMPIFRDPVAFQQLLDGFKLHIKQHNLKIDAIVGLDARGFIFGPALALQLGVAFVPVRKRGKLPGETVAVSYQKEYAADVFEMQSDAVSAGQHIIIVDDIIATGGSAAAAGELVTKLGGKVEEYWFLLELDFLKGRDKLNAPVFTLLQGQPEKLSS